MRKALLAREVSVRADTVRKEVVRCPAADEERYFGGRVFSRCASSQVVVAHRIQTESYGRHTRREVDKSIIRMSHLGPVYHVDFASTNHYHVEERGQ